MPGAELQLRRLVGPKADELRGTAHVLIVCAAISPIYRGTPVRLDFGYLGRVRFQEVSPEVLQSQGPIVQISGDDIRSLKERAERSPRRRARICAHPGPDDRTHEMLIVLLRGNLIRPHFHPGKVESFHVMAGLMSVVQFNEDGSILEVVRMGDYGSGRTFYYRQTRPIHHTLLCESDHVAFHETTQGPFSRDGTTHPAWAPDENAGDALKIYLDDLRRRTGVEPDPPR